MPSTQPGGPIHFNRVSPTHMVPATMADVAKLRKIGLYGKPDQTPDGTDATFATGPFDAGPGMRYSFAYLPEIGDAARRHGYAGADVNAVPRPVRPPAPAFFRSAFADWADRVERSVSPVKPGFVGFLPDGRFLVEPRQPAVATRQPADDLRDAVVEFVGLHKVMDDRNGDHARPGRPGLLAAARLNRNIGKAEARVERALTSARRKLPVYYKGYVVQYDGNGEASIVAEKCENFEV